MRGSFKTIPDDVSYGDATPALRQLLEEWQSVDWFEPPRNTEKAVEYLREHNRLCHREYPAHFAPAIRTSVLLGDWNDFVALRQRRSSWCWKDSGLKRMTIMRSERLGYDLASDAVEMTMESQESSNALIMLFRPEDSGRSAVIWNSLQPSFDLRNLPRPYTEVAYWYINYSAIDVTMGIEWQLADRSAPLEANPFLSLTRCLTEGFYPFLFDRDEAILFGFSETGLAAAPGS